MRTTTMPMSLWSCAAGALLVLTACESGTARTAAKKSVQNSRPADTEQSSALTDAEVKNQVSSYLGSIDTPVASESWQGLGERGAVELERIVSDASALPTRRARAIDGLAAMQRASAASAIEALAMAETENVAVRFSAVRAMSTLQRDAALIAILKGAKDARVRAVAAESLSNRSGGCSAVAAALEGETLENRALFAKSAARCQGN